jgi:hypothetical protein
MNCDASTTTETRLPGSIKLCYECKWFTPLAKVKGKTLGQCQVGILEVKPFCKEYVPKRWENEPWEND